MDRKLYFALMLGLVLPMGEKGQAVTFSTARLRFGEYRISYKNLNYSININKDSTFQYVERYEWPLRVTRGNWSITDRTLILNSVPDTNTYDPYRHFDSTRGFPLRGQYIIFRNEQFIVKRNRLVAGNNRQIRYKFYREK